MSFAPQAEPADDGLCPFVSTSHTRHRIRKLSIVDIRTQKRLMWLH
jgi:hypothetical protein